MHHLPSLALLIGELLKIKLEPIAEGIDAHVPHIEELEIIV